MNGFLPDLVRSIRKQILTGEIRKWLFLGVFIGIIAGVGALVIYYSIELFTYLLAQNVGMEGIPYLGNPGFSSTTILPQTSFFISPSKLLIPISTTIGGLASGYLVYRFAPETEGHGTDAAIDAFHNKAGRVRRRVPIIKTVASAITIGSGGSAGREGPTAQIAAGFGSYIADVFRLSDKDRRTAVAAGIGAGIGSIFLAPLGGALLSTEILYRRDFEVEAFIPSIIASVVGYSIFGYIFGYRPLFYIPGTYPLGFGHPSSLIVYILVGLLAGIAGILFVKTFYGMAKFFNRKVRGPRMLKPAIGGLAVGLMAMYFPEVLGLGYVWTQEIFLDPYYFPLWMLIALIFLKMIATSLTVGSGGSGGVFAPGMVIGGFVGASIGVVIQPFFPFLSVLEITIVGMIAFFGGISKAPLSVIIMGTEMTQSYTLFLPLMVATIISYFVTGDNGIYRSQVLSRAYSPAHKYEYEKPILDDLLVRDAMKKDYLWVEPSARLSDVMLRIRESKTKNAVVKSGNLLMGMVSMDSLMAADPGKESVADVLDPHPLTIGDGESVHQALEKLVKSDQGKLVVVKEGDPQSVVGTIGLAEIADAYNMEIRRIREQQSMQGGT